MELNRLNVADAETLHCNLCSYGLYNYDQYSYGLCSHGQYSHGLYSYGQHSHGRRGDPALQRVRPKACSQYGCIRG